MGIWSTSKVKASGTRWLTGPYCVCHGAVKEGSVGGRQGLPIGFLLAIPSRSFFSPHFVLVSSILKSVASQPKSPNKTARFLIT